MSHLAAPLAFPLGGDLSETPTAPGYPDQIDHQVRGLGRLLQQFKGEAHPNIQALVAAPLAVSNTLEAVFMALLMSCHLFNATGWFLDEWGAILNLERDGRDDDAYRVLLYAWLKVLVSSGTWPQVIDVLDGIDDMSTTEHNDMAADPASFRIRVLSPALAPADVALYRKFLRPARAAGVKLWFGWRPRLTGIFRFCSESSRRFSSATGFGGEGLSTGGHLRGVKVT